MRARARHHVRDSAACAYVLGPGWLRSLECRPATSSGMHKNINVIDIILRTENKYLLIKYLLHIRVWIGMNRVAYTNGHMKFNAAKASHTAYATRWQYYFIDVDQLPHSFVSFCYWCEHFFDPNQYETLFGCGGHSSCIVLCADLFSSLVAFDFNVFASSDYSFYYDERRHSIFIPLY